ncbi:alpha/beta fold hydrolase [Streptomyces melanogenes]|uniref:alpha/beta fold hydrolase n=1 Tax=Streptomyces melanogenes TaxID=67326 RepID=UPI0037A36F07
MANCETHHSAWFSGCRERRHPLKRPWPQPTAWLRRVRGLNPWAGASAAFPASAASPHNPDFVDVVIHSYRHRFGLVEGDPRYQELDDLIAAQPPISVPTVVLESGDDGVGGPSAAEDRGCFTGPYEHRLLPGVGHNFPQEAPAVFTDAVASLLPR